MLTGGHKGARERARAIVGPGIELGDASTHHRSFTTVAGTDDFANVRTYMEQSGTKIRSGVA
jgi:hypothetical protein